MQQTTAMLALLQWQVAMGATEAVSEVPENWLAAPPPAPEPAAQPVQAAPADRSKVTPIKPASAPNISLAETVSAAEQAASGADSLEALSMAVHAFDGCPLKKTARNTVFAAGNFASKLLLIGEAPSASDDLSGEAFSGEAGALLNKMLAAIGLSRDTDCALINGVFWRPPGNRPPTAEEAAICLPFLKRFIALQAPTQIVLLGGGTAKVLLGETRSLSQLRAASLQYAGAEVRATLAPSTLLRQPLQKKLAWQDLLALKAAISQ